MPTEARMPPAKENPIILLVAEAVTLAHFARISTLARALADYPCRVVVASDPRYRALDQSDSREILPIHSLSGAEFNQALMQGKPLYSAQTLARYVEEDLALIDRVKPDLIVGDFRLSLSVSAPLRGVPYAAVVNAYWSPYADIRYPVPDIPLTRLLGNRLAQPLFDLARPLAFALHARPLNRVRRRFGLPSLGHDLRRGYTWGDYTLYADIPEVVPTRPLPPNHRFIGPVLWSTRTPLPDWWDGLPDDKPIVCITLGSSGRADFLPAALMALARLPITVIAATLGKMTLPPLPDNVFVADYLPLETALERSRLLVCNGGSLSTYQALARGIPVIGICSNLDQLLNMDAMERLGCGISLRAAGLAPDALGQAVRTLLDSSPHARAAVHLARVLESHDSGRRFRAAVADMLGRPRPSPLPD